MPKYKSLVVKIWLVLVAMTIGLFVLIICCLPFFLHSFFTNDVYDRIESMQSHFQETSDKDSFVRDRPQDRRDVRIEHVVLFDSNSPFVAHLHPLILKKIEQEAKSQKEETKRYLLDTGDGKLLYVIYKNNDTYILSYAWSDFPNHLTNQLFKQLLLLMSIVLLISFPISVFLAKFLSKPLLQIEGHVQKIADRKWNESLILRRKDEIGQIALSIEKLRRRLIKQDNKQQTFIQHVSHELKTPVMVIRTYIQGIRDNIFPQGDLTSSLSVIDEETERLEKKIQNLLLLTKLDYLEEEKRETNPCESKDIMEKTIEKFRYANSSIEWKSDLVSATVLGDAEQLAIACENLLDNQLRYAKHEITISSYIEDVNGIKSLFMTFYNDGDSISLDNPNVIFEPFYKGKKGQFGLGLAIVKQIIEKHNGRITVTNQPTGVLFKVKLPILDITFS